MFLSSASSGTIVALSLFLSLYFFLSLSLPLSSLHDIAHQHFVITVSVALLFLLVRCSDQLGMFLVLQSGKFLTSYL